MPRKKSAPFRRTYSKVKWAHRRLKMSAHNLDPQRGDDVKALQRAFNHLPASVRGGDGVKLVVDGESGRATVGRCRHAARALGVGLRGPGVSPYVQHLIRHPTLRSPVQRRRGERFRKAHPAAPPKAKVTGNSVTGGTVRERIVAVHLEAAHLYYTGQSHRFYSQVGGWDIDHPVTGPTPGHRDDCSSYETGVYKCAGAPDLNGNNFNGGWTGTIVAHCREIRREELRPGDPVVYGPGSGHHTEGWVGNGDGKTTYAELDRQGSPFRDRTVGHGSPAVDFGDIDMMAGARFFRAPGLD